MLFSPIKVGALTLDNRMVMAPLTRTRAGYEHLPNALMAEYYAQRASAGLIITECTMITPNTSAFAAEPGVYSAEQIEAWKLTTNAVHEKGGKIFMQIWHAGRAAHPDLNGGAPTFSASGIAINGDVHTQNGMVPHVAPQELSVEQIQVIVQEFAQAAKNAIAAGFDGV